MKYLLMVVLFLMATFAYPQYKIDIDWRWSAISTNLVDIYQTNHFNTYNMREEWNPVAKVLLKSGPTTFMIFSLFSIYEIDHLIQTTIKNRSTQNWIYGGWFLVESLAVLNNCEHKNPGIPFLLLVIKF